MLVLGAGSVFPQSSIHLKRSYSLPENLDAGVKSDPHKTCEHSYMYMHVHVQGSIMGFSM